MRVGKITASWPVLLAMSVSTEDAILVSPPFGRFRLWLVRLRLKSVPVHDKLSEDTPLEQLLVHSQWKPASSAHPERSKVVIYQDDDTGWEYPQAVAKQLGWDAKQIQIRKKPAEK